MGIQVRVEVTDEIIRTNTGKEKQVVYVDLGERYPSKFDIWVNDRPLQPGSYIATKLRKKGFDAVLDLERGLQPAKASAPQAKAG